MSEAQHVDIVPASPTLVCAATAAPDGSGRGSIEDPDGPVLVTAPTFERLRVGMLAHAALTAKSLHRPVRVTFITADGTRLLAVHPDGYVEDVDESGQLAAPPAPGDRQVLRGPCRGDGCTASVPISARFCPTCRTHLPHAVHTAAAAPPVTTPTLPADPLPAAWPFDTTDEPTAAPAPVPLVVGTHPGAGASTWATLLQLPEQSLPDVLTSTASVLLVCRTVPAAIAATKQAIHQIGAARVHAVLIVADAPGRPVPAAAREQRVLAGAVTVIAAPWLPRLRGVTTIVPALAGALARPVRRIRNALERASTQPKDSLS